MKQIRKQVEINCSFCNKTFQKDESEVKRNSKLNRKNSNIGYNKDNIQFISIAMNHLKNTMTEEEMQQILFIIKNITNE